MLFDKMHLTDVDVTTDMQVLAKLLSEVVASFVNATLVNMLDFDDDNGI